MNAKAIIFDWAGTTVDYGCRAPVAAIEKLFLEHGLSLEPTESRHAMGLLKKDQLREILTIPRVARLWHASYGRPSTETDVERLFEDFIPLQLDCVEQYSAVIPGVAELIERLRSRDIRIGTTTGYTRPMLAIVQARASREDYTPDFTITPDETSAGRPAPWMIFENLRALNIYPPCAVIKVGDTPSDMAEALNAGVHAFGVVLSSNETAAYGESRARERLIAAGATVLLNKLEDLEDHL